MGSSDSLQAAPVGVTDVGGFDLRAAAQAGRLPRVRELLAAGVAVDAIDEQGEAALHKACRCCSVDCAELLLAHGADANRRNRRGQAPIVLLWEIYPQRASTLNVLLQHGADPRTCTPEGWFVSQLAAVHAEVELVESLQRQAESRFPLADDPVDWAAHRSAATLCLGLRRNDRAVMHAWAEDPDLEPEQLVAVLQPGLREVLFEACAGGWRSLVVDLLDGGAALGMTDQHGCSLLNIAERHGQRQLLEYLMARGAALAAESGISEIDQRTEKE